MAENAARLSLVVALLVLGLKAFAYLLTGSVALLSDALESLVNVAAALLALLAIRFAQRPPDETHPFGHSKAEYFSAVLEGVLVVLAAFLIAKESIPRLLHPRPLGDLGPGLLVSLLASLINGLLAWHLLRQGRRLRSPALTADDSKRQPDGAPLYTTRLGHALMTDKTVHSPPRHAGPAPRGTRRTTGPRRDPARVLRR